MIKSLTNIIDISVIDQNVSENLYSFKIIDYSDDQIGSGGFGSVHKVMSIDGRQTTDFVIKLLFDESDKLHPYQTIKLLHEKVKLRQNRTQLPIYHEYPELLGMPFMVFKGYDQISDKHCVAFLIYDLFNLGYLDYGSDNNQLSKLNTLDMANRFYLAYQLARTVNLLHEFKFIHSDLNEHSIFINFSRIQLVIIDFDSGYHFDKQNKPGTIGKISYWIGQKFSSLIRDKSNSDSLTLEDRKYEEFWILGNAIFELLFGVAPFYFLSDSDNNTIRKYLEDNEWPDIDYGSQLLNKSSVEHHKLLLSKISMLESLGVHELIINFKSIFNKGFSNESKRLSPSEWKTILFRFIELAELQPVISSFYSSKSTIARSNENVRFDWSVGRFNRIYLNGQLVPLNQFYTALPIEDSTEIKLRAINDFSELTKAISIRALKVPPEIIEFIPSVNIRSSLDKIVLSWKTRNVLNVSINSISGVFPANGNIEVEPTEMTIYTLKALGYFYEEIEISITIDVTKANIKKWEYEINIDEGIDNIDLIWDTENAKDVTISPDIGVVEKSGIIHVKIHETTEFTLTVNGFFNQTLLTLSAIPFPIPILDSILVPDPIFNSHISLESKYKILSNLNAEEIMYTNNIDFQVGHPSFINFKEDLIINKLNIRPPSSNGLLSHLQNIIFIKGKNK
jgi:serine/threonine protein kinase